MADLPESPVYDVGVYQLETTDAVVGGVAGKSNAAAINLARRTAYLKQHVDALEAHPTTMLTKSVAGGANVVLSDAEAANGILKFTGVITANIAVIVPSSPTRSWIIDNATTGAYTLTVITAAGTGVVVSQSADTPVYTDGVNVLYETTIVSQAMAEAGTDVLPRAWTAERVKQAALAATLSGMLTKSVAGSANVTLTAAEVSNSILKFTGLLTGNISVIVPVSPIRGWVIDNATTGAFTLTVKTPIGTGVVVAQSADTPIYTDGVNVLYETTIVSQAIAEAGTDVLPRAWTAERVKQAILSLNNSVETGTIGKFAQSVLPTGWLPTIPGATASRTSQAALFAKIGTRYGDGDGSTTFSLPVHYSMFENFLSATDLPVALFDHTVTLLNDGRILIIGGSTVNGTPLASTYFGTITGNSISWVAGTALITARYEHTTTYLADGRILVCGGSNGTSSLVSTVFGTISGNTITWATGSVLPAALSKHTDTLLPDGRLLLTGGYDGSFSVSETRFGTISGNAITWALGTALPNVQYGHAETLLSDGRVLITGGIDGTTAKTNTWFLTIAANTITYTAGTPLPSPRCKHTALLLLDSRILITSGSSDAGTVVSGTLYGAIAPNNISLDWGVPNGTDFHSLRYDHTALILPDHRLLVTGGVIGGVTLSSTYFGIMALNGIRT